jgi:N-formylglutamate amidohydrolase
MSLPLPIAIILPHACLALPPEVAGSVALNESAIFNEADVYADRLFGFAGAVAYWECFPYARAVLDVNRSSDPEANRPGDGVVKQRTSYGEPVWRSGHGPDAALETLLVRRYWAPWHERLAAIAANPQVRLVIDAHSMAALGPSAYDDPARLRARVMVANGGDWRGERRAPEEPVTASPALLRWWAPVLGGLLADVPACCPTGPDYAINDPFTGGADLQLHGGYHQPWIMVEINRALYLGLQDGTSPPQPADEDKLALLRDRIWMGILQLLERLNHDQG